ncbi:hypothetical protein B4109_2468 [Geobacillus stearothermophilus]|uniref:Uncharacterized protein n=1 Tax=Geobacillus stearothermophilus TaxID=1422 RepID=A0A150M8L0_GEOSE|nr:hypothetical protein B4109_2468 [Geobacillus stearothermophilus]
MLSFEPCWARSSFHTKTVLAADLREPKKKTAIVSSPSGA